MSKTERVLREVERSLLNGDISERSGADSLVVDEDLLSSKTPAERALREIEKRLENGDVPADRSDLERLVYEA